MNDRQVNELGVEMTLAINHFGHFLLTYLLFPLIKLSKEARIINLSSAAHKHTSDNTSEDISCERSWGSIGVYSRSKLANVQFTVGLAERLTKYPHIKAMCLHPGVVDSEFGTGITGLGCFKCFCCCIYVDNETGARTSLHLSRTAFSSLRSGEYYDNNTELTTMNELGRNREHVNNLWRTSEKLFNI
jgi:NAD(P)-dependent dehydrogenase (short-subunit alcohol dehydrogenase family)